MTKIMPFAYVYCLCALLILVGGCARQSDTPESPTSAASAVVAVNFIESAPKDRFVITNEGTCPLPELTVELDLAQSAGKLIFDTSETGAGVEVFQPFEVVAGDITQIGDANVTDGDSQLALRIANLASDDAASFTIDVDDTLPAGELGQIRVAGSEISGGVVSVSLAGAELVTGQFDENGTVRINLPACP